MGCACCGESKTKVSKQQQEAIDAFVADIPNNTKLPTFEWRFRKNFQDVPIGEFGAQTIVSALTKASLGNLQNSDLKALELQRQSFGDRGVKVVADTIINNEAKIFRNLCVVNLSGNACGDGGCEALGAALASNNTQIQRLLFTENQFTAKGLLWLCLGACKAMSLQELHLGVTTNEKISILPVSNDQLAASSALASLTTSGHLKHLTLVNTAGLSWSELNNFLRKGIASAESTVEELNLSGAPPRDMSPKEIADVQLEHAFEALGKACSNYSCLRVLSIKFLPVTSSAVSSFCQALNDNRASSSGSWGPSLDSLAFINCELDSPTLLEFGTMFQEAATRAHPLTALKKFDITGNKKCSSAALQKLILSFGGMKHLREFNMAQIIVDDTVGEALLQTIGSAESQCLITHVRHSAFPNDALHNRVLAAQENAEKILAERASKPQDAPLDDDQIELQV